MITKYESMIIIDPNFNETEANSINEELLAFVKNLGGEIIDTDNWGKRKLAYEIKKKSEGFYFVNYFKFPGKNIKDLERYYKLNEKIIRYNILRSED